MSLVTEENVKLDKSLHFKGYMNALDSLLNVQINMCDNI